MPEIEDHFSKQALSYARHRPLYPQGLFQYLANLTGSHDLAWDCGTGSGQAAKGLTQYYQRVIASDILSAQIAQAIPHPKVFYIVGSAEKSELESQSVDIITIAQALHWFKLARFFTEVRRVLKPGGIIAAWCYHLTQITPPIDEILENYYTKIVGPYWSDRIQLVNDHYQTIPFPFHQIAAPKIYMETLWDLSDILGYLDSWSATQAFIETRGYNPIEEIESELHLTWGNPEKKRSVYWPLYFKIGTIPVPEQKNKLLDR